MSLSPPPLAAPAAASAPVTPPDRPAAPPERPAAAMARERGSVTLVALGLSVFVMLAGVAAVDVGLLAAARVRVQTAADLAALAALTPAAGGAAAGSAAAGPVGAGAAGASLLAEANGAELRGCDCSTWQAVVTVRRRVVLPPSACRSCWWRGLERS